MIRITETLKKKKIRTGVDITAEGIQATTCTALIQRRTVWLLWVIPIFTREEILRHNG